jgi:ComF family protein
MEKNIPPLCESCSRPIRGLFTPKKVCPRCIKRNLRFDHAFSPYPYRGVIKNLIHKFKYEGKDFLAPFLANLMLDFVKEYSLALELFGLIMPVASHKTKLRQRGFNQAQLLAEELSRSLSINLCCDNLCKIYNPTTQTQLGELQRFENIKGNFYLKSPYKLKQKNILLIDDVLTTGATASEIASVLKAAGAGIVFVLTLAN